MSASPSSLHEASEAFLLSNARNDAPSPPDTEPENARGDDGPHKEFKSEVDPSIVEALKSKDRLFVLRLGEQMESLITEQKTQIDVLPSTSYQKLLVHRCSAYYKLRPENDPSSKGLIVIRTLESKIPIRRLCDLVPAELPSAPAFKIMTRGSKDRSRSKAYSQSGSPAGEDADLSDVEPSEAGSIGGRSNATGNSKKHMTIEEREAAYKEARSRIFMDFEDKEKDKEKDMSGSSSTRSLVSGSGGETSSVGDIDDCNSTAPTESEWSGPIAHDKREGRRGKGSSNRSYYAPYPYQPHPYPITHSEPVSPSGGDVYGPFPPPQVGYNPYWVPHQQQPPPPPGSIQGPPPQPPQHSPHQPTALPHPQPVPQYPPPNAPMYAPPYGPPHMYGQYPMPPYYPPQSAPPSQLPTSPQMQPQLLYPPDLSHGSNLPAGGNPNGNGNGNGSVNHSRTSSRNSSNNGGRRAPPQARHAWTYGPGIGNYGGNETVGPRLTSSMRRQSGASSVGSASTGNRTPGDETSSIASSSTSSSSRRTFTSTSTTSKHPLPARPDWAVGLKPQAHHRHHDHNNTSRNGSSQQQSQPGPPQPTDFPPLTLSSPPKAPVAGGAWTNSSSTRSILMPNAAQPGQPSTYGSALVQYPNTNGNVNQSPRLDSQAFERPPPKGSAELFNPKGRRPTINTGNGGGKVGSPPLQEKGEKSRSEALANVVLADRMSAMIIDGKSESHMDTAPAADGLRPDGIIPSS